MKHKFNKEQEDGLVTIIEWLEWVKDTMYRTDVFTYQSILQAKPGRLMEFLVGLHRKGQYDEYDQRILNAIRTFYLMNKGKVVWDKDFIWSLPNLQSTPL